MAVKFMGKWVCGYCGKPYVDAAKADSCRDSHSLIYVPLTATDLNRLLLFIQTKNEEYLTESLMNTLQRYLGGN